MQLKESVDICRKYNVLFQEISLIENKREDMVQRAQHRGHTFASTKKTQRHIPLLSWLHILLCLASSPATVVRQLGSEEAQT